MGLHKKQGGQSNGKLSRKQLRKQQRVEKKARRAEYFSRKKNNKKDIQKQSVENQVNKNSISGKQDKLKKDGFEKQNLKKDTKGHTEAPKYNNVIEQQNIKEKKEQKKLIKDMAKQRKTQLLKANEQEDQVLRKLEKQLKLNRRKTKSIPKSFIDDGLAYMIEATDLDNMKDMASAEQDLKEVGDEFDEDFALMTGSKAKKSKKNDVEESSDDLDNFEEMLNEDEFSDDSLADNAECNDTQTKLNKIKNKRKDKTQKNKQISKEDSDNSELIKNKSKTSNLTRKESLIKKNKQSKFIKDESENTSNDSDSELEDAQINNRKSIKNKVDNEKRNRTLEEQSQNSKGKKRKTDNTLNEQQVKKQKTEQEVEDKSDNDFDSEGESLDEDETGEEDKGDGVWEDIYGRMRSKDGTVINASENKYIPPAIRARMAVTGTDDKKRKEKMDRLKKQLKGLLNRLTESNMHSIATQIENMYMSNSRNDMNETMTSLTLESLVSNVATPERLLMEHILLITILHANVGTEIGAHFLENIIERFNSLLNSDSNEADKSLSNVVNILAQLYNFKVFDVKLLFEILHKLAERFDERNIECILNVLRTVGFSVRKDDPLALKDLILELQKQAASANSSKISNSRIKFMLDILLAIKNNNVRKIPNYDPSYSEHLKKIMKGFIRKGNYVTQLNISLEDLLNAESRGKWWVVGSAWTGNLDNQNKKEESRTSQKFSQRHLDLAKKHRMNTDSRRDIFCSIVSAEDCLDAFEKLLKLGLKNQQDRDIIHVLLHCCLAEKAYNAFYAVLVQKFCDYDRKYQMIIKCSIWDKLKTLGNHSAYQISNLAKLLTHLFIEKGLPISTLKRVEFIKLDKVMLRFVRQILLGILLHNDIETIHKIFEKVALSNQLKMFRESLRLFIHQFVLEHLKKKPLPDDQKDKLKERVKMVEKLLMAKDNRLRL